MKQALLTLQCSSNWLLCTSTVISHLILSENKGKQQKKKAFCQQRRASKWQSWIKKEIRPYRQKRLNHTDTLFILCHSINMNNTSVICVCVHSSVFESVRWCQQPHWLVLRLSSVIQSLLATRDDTIMWSFTVCK